MNLRNIDLNLLVVLEALLSERSVSRAGEQIGLTQPAMSAALGRLRLMFDDPLLIRVGRGLELTRKAEALALPRSEEHTSELQSLMRISYAVFCLKKKNNKHNTRLLAQT